MKLFNFKRGYSISQGVIEEIKAQFRKFEGGRINLRRKETIAFVEIDHPEKKNGMSGRMMTELHDAILDLENNWPEGKGLILYGSSGTFCSGGYLPTVKQILNSEDGYRMATLMHDTVLRLRNLPLVSASLISGRALGGGAELSLATDFRLMERNAEIRFVEARMGVGTGWGGGMLLKEIVGRSKALELLLSCRPITADEGVKLGLVDEILEGESEGALLNSANDWLKKLVEHHHVSVVNTVKNIVTCDGLEEEAKVFSKSWGGEVQKSVLGSGGVKHK